MIKRLANGALLCTACGHRCKLQPGQRGVCKVRFNEDNTLKVPFNYVSGTQNDPIEKKPFFHAIPGSRAFSFGMLGCDFHCAYCQNWFTSQSLRDSSATLSLTELDPEDICDLAQKGGAQSVISTYNEPLITSEWAVAIFREARARGLVTGFVSNGHATPEVLNYLSPWLDLYKVDLKSFNAREYRRLGGNLEEVLESIRGIHSMGFWLEIVTLVIPNYNDSSEELSQIAEFISSVSPGIPWHVTGFHPYYKMTDRGATPVATILSAREIGKKAGLYFVYSGNRPGQVENTENTFCPDCGETLIERLGFHVYANRLEFGACPACQCVIPGFWYSR